MEERIRECQLREKTQKEKLSDQLMLIQKQIDLANEILDGSYKDQVLEVLTQQRSEVFARYKELPDEPVYK